MAAVARDVNDVVHLQEVTHMSASIDGPAIDKVLRDAVDSGGVPHVAAIAADRDGVIYQGAAGPRAAGESDPVTVDTLFRIMSMTKMPCTVAALQQVEQGNLDLDAPVADYCPEFAEVQVTQPAVTARAWATSAHIW